MFHRLKIENKTFFEGYDKGNSLQSHLLKFAIEKEVASSAFTPTSSHRSLVGKLNEYGYNGLFLRTDDFIVTLSKTYKPMMLPPSSRYRKQLSETNGQLATQLRLDFDGFVIDEDFKYAIITYGRDANFELSHLNILTPEPNYSGIIKDLSVNILRDSNLVVMPDAITDEQLSTLKDELQTKLKHG